MDRSEFLSRCGELNMSYWKFIPVHIVSANRFSLHLLTDSSGANNAPAFEQHPLSHIVSTDEIKVEYPDCSEIKTEYPDCNDQSRSVPDDVSSHSVKAEAGEIDLEIENYPGFETVIDGSYVTEPVSQVSVKSETPWCSLDYGLRDARKPRAEQNKQMPSKHQDGGRTSEMKSAPSETKHQTIGMSAPSETRHQTIRMTSEMKDASKTKHRTIGMMSGTKDAGKTKHQAVRKTLKRKGATSKTKHPTRRTMSKRKHAFICHFCGHSFRFLSQLTIHERVHTGMRPYQCQLCDKSYKVNNHLREHMQSKHCTERPHKCEKCSKDFALKRTLQHHRKTCGVNKISLEKPVKRMYECSVCRKSFTRSHSRKLHMRIHTGYRPFQCKLCDTSFKMSFHLSYHMQLKHSTEKPHKCEKCGTCFALKCSLRRHQKKCVHKISLKNSSPVQFEQICYSHGEPSQGERWEEVMKGSHQETMGEGNKSGEDGKSEQRYVTVQDQQNPNRNQCSNCEMDHAYPLKKLVKRTFECNICRKSFTRSDSRKLHMRIHTGYRPFRCKLCDTSFKVSSHLSDHMQLKHSTEKPHKCEKCGTCFALKYSLRRHQKKCGVHRILPQNFAPVQFEQMCYSHGESSQGEMWEGAVQGSDQETMEEGNKPGEDEKSEQRDVTVQNLWKGKHSVEKCYKCERCSKCSPSPRALKRHQQRCGVDRSLLAKYICVSCGKIFCTPEGLERHRIKCGVDKSDLESVLIKAKPHRCADCGKSFATLVGLSRHQNFACGKVRQIPYVCQECGKTFSTRTKYHTHVHRHPHEMPFKCVCCKAVFSSLGMLKEHETKHMIDKDSNEGQVKRVVTAKHVCLRCDASFYFVRTLHLHMMKVHFGATPYTCPDCRLEFPKRYMLCHHTRLVHKKESVEGCICSLKFSTCSQQKHQNPTDHPQQFECGKTAHILRRCYSDAVACELCKTAFSTWDLYRHIKLKHSDLSLRDVVRGPVFGCSCCSKEFLGIDKLITHEQQHTRGRQFQCDKCSSCFFTKQALKQHQAMHSNYLHLCSVCGKQFRWAASLNFHMNTHNSPEPPTDADGNTVFYTCKKCGKTFMRRASYYDHMRYHKVVSPLLCSKCGQRCTSLRRLKTHMSRHESSKRYSCHTCGVGFYFPHQLRNHMNCKHSLQNQKPSWLCAVCGTCFFSKRGLESHMKLHVTNGKGSRRQRKRQVRAYYDSSTTESEGDDA